MTKWREIRRTLSGEREAKIKRRVEEELAKLPLAIETEEQNKECTAALFVLTAKPDPTREEEEAIELMTRKIQDFEERHYQLPKASPVEVLSFLIDQNGLRPADLLDVFGTASIVSEVLNGNRALTSDNIARLSERFHVSPEVFS
jgi:HTH-type transcriptional regulator/antitoxin HigA